MASTYDDENSKFVFSGFRQFSYGNNNIDIGIGIAEGYTEVLNNRYFENNKFFCNYLSAYQYEVT